MLLHADNCSLSLIWILPVFLLMSFFSPESNPWYRLHLVVMSTLSSKSVTVSCLSLSSVVLKLLKVALVSYFVKYCSIWVCLMFSLYQSEKYSLWYPPSVLQKGCMIFSTSLRLCVSGFATVKLIFPLWLVSTLCSVFDIVQMFCFSSYFCPLISTSINGSCLQ